MPMNPGQEEAVRHGAGPAMVLAGPGSGKTMVITHRVRHLVEELHVEPSHILVITFTKAAAMEMEERFGRLMGGKRPPVTFGTFHAVFFKILKYAYNFSAASIARPEQKNAFLRELIDQAEMETEDEGELLSSLAAEISAVKGDTIELENYYSQCCPAEVFRQIYEGYEERMRRASLIDFDDMMKLCYELFAQRPDILASWQKKYQYILVDEFQDINRLQYEIVRMLAEPKRNLFVVGDDDQSIYRFRGARPEIMLGFPEDYPEGKRILLDINYRCVPSVIEAAGRLIGQNEARYRKNLRAAQTGTEPVTCRSYADLMEENDAVIRALQDYHSQGIPYEEMALLYRTNSGPRVMAGQLVRCNLPFQMGDVVPNLYEHWISKDVLTYLLLAAGSRARSDFLRIIHKPKRYIPRSAFPNAQVSFDELRQAVGEKEWMADRVDRLEYDLRMLAKMRPWAAVNYVRRGIGYEEYVREFAEARHIRPDELFQVLDELQESAEPFATLAEWMEHMQEYTEKLAEQKKKDRSERQGVAIATMHGSKGLEYRVVFLPNANEGITPHGRAVLDADIEEERRLFYVAMTRAKTHLHISFVRERFNREMAPSRFVKETGVPVEVIQKIGT